MNQKIIYVDNAATTPTNSKVLEAMLPYFCDNYGNPSSVYSLGRDNRQAVDTARAQVAKALNCMPQEVYFTAGGSESDNWAIKGAAHKLAAKGKKHLITTAIEHHAVLHSMAALEREGFEVTYLPVDEYGLVSPAAVEAAIRPDTALVSIMYANNEIGTIEPIAEIGAICRKNGVWFHTDAVQAVGAVAIDVQAQNIDMLSLSAHKLNGPKGIGAFYCKRGVLPTSLIDGGAQESGRRAGTENVPAIVGLGKAIEIATSDIPAKAAKIGAMRDYVIERIMKNVPEVKLNGHPTNRLPGNVNFSFKACEGESLLLFLDMKGICASSGSACTSGSLDPSHVLLAIGLPHEIAHGSLRISFGAQNTMEETTELCDILENVVEEVRRRSPLWHKNNV